MPDGKKPPAWFAFDESRPLAFFAGIWTLQWRSVRKVKEGETTNDLYAFLTADANAEVGAIHPKAMPVILTTVLILSFIARVLDSWIRCLNLGERTITSSQGRAHQSCMHTIGIVLFRTIPKELRLTPPRDSMIPRLL